MSDENVEGEFFLIKNNIFFYKYFSGFKTIFEKLLFSYYRDIVKGTSEYCPSAYDSDQFLFHFTTLLW